MNQARQRVLSVFAFMESGGGGGGWGQREGGGGEADRDQFTMGQRDTHPSLRVYL